jgi:hypothetical protein
MQSTRRDGLEASKPQLIKWQEPKTHQIETELQAAVDVEPQLAQTTRVPKRNIRDEWQAAG